MVLKGFFIFSAEGTGIEISHAQVKIIMEISTDQTIYSQMQRFADITKALIIQGNIQRAKKCLKTAEQLLNTGNSEIKTAVSNVYIFSVSVFMEIHHCSIKNLFPETLQAEYYKQVNASDI